MKMLTRFPAIPACLILTATLMTACGGGGDKKNAASPGSGTLSGSSTKGIIRNGVITVSQFDAAGDQVTIGTGRTTADGRYSLSYADYNGGLVLVCVTADAQTTVVCDASDGPNCGPSNGVAGDTNANGTFDLGEELPAPADFRMCTCLTEPPAEGISAPITPFTNAVVLRAEERAANEELRTALLNAASEVGQLLGGLDVLRLDPVDLSDADAVAGASPEALVYSALIAAVLGNSVDALGAGESLDLNAVVQRIVDSTAGGRIGLSDFRNLLREAQEQLLALGRSDRSGVLASLNDQADAIEAGGGNSFDPEPNPDANADGISRARGLIRNLRNVYASIESYDAPLEAVGLDLDAAGQALLASEAMAHDVGNAMSAAGQFLVSAPACADENCAQTRNGVTTTFSSDGTTLTGSVSGTSTVDSTVYDLLVTAPANRGDGATTLAFNIQRASVRNASARASTSQGTVTVVLNEAFDPAALEDEDTANDQDASIIDSVSVDAVATVEALSGNTVLASATGTVRASVVAVTQCALAPTQDNLEPELLPASIEIRGALSSGANSADVGLQFTLANARSFCPNRDLGPNNVPQASATLTANLALEAVPSARVVATAAADGLYRRTPDQTDDRTVGVLANATVSLLQDNVQVFRIAAATTRPQGANNELATATITDANNVAIVLQRDLGPQSAQGDLGVISVDGARVGVIRQLGSGLVIARYDDGSFESLF